MRTTVALESRTRDRILALKRSWGASSVDDVLTRLLDGPALGARALYRQKQKAVDKVLKQRGVKRLIAFGSRARGDARPDSDLDLAGSLPPGSDLLTVVNVQLDLEEAFGVKVQFIPLDAVPKKLRAGLEQDGVTLVG